MTRMISVRDSIYDELLKIKKSEESFSQLFERIAKESRQKSIMNLAGAWSDWKEADKTFETILKRKSKRTKKVF